MLGAVGGAGEEVAALATPAPTPPRASIPKTDPEMLLLSFVVVCGPNPTHVLQASKDHCAHTHLCGR